jgi:hypothetical protein
MYYKDTYMGTLLPTIVFLLECVMKERRKQQENNKMFMLPLVDAIVSGIHARFDDVMDDGQVIAASILIPKFKNHWTDDNSQLKKGLGILSILVWLMVKGLSIDCRSV